MELAHLLVKRGDGRKETSHVVLEDLPAVRHKLAYLILFGRLIGAPNTTNCSEWIERICICLLCVIFHQFDPAHLVLLERKRYDVVIEEWLYLDKLRPASCWVIERQDKPSMLVTCLDLVGQQKLILVLDWKEVEVILQNVIL